MGLTDRLIGPIVERYLSQKASTGQYPAWALAMAENARFNIPNMTLPEKQAELYQRLSWVAIAVGTVAKVGAGVPLEVMRVVGEDEEQIINHPFEELLKRPNPRRSRFEFLEATLLWYQLTGNAYWWLNRRNENAPPDEAWIIPSHRLEPVPDGKMYLKGYLYDPGDGQKMPLEPWEIVHFRRFNPFDAFVGMSPVEALANVAVGDIKMQEWNTNFFGEHNAKIPGALTFADPIPDPEWERLKADFAENYGGSKRNLLMLRNTGAGGVNWVAMAMSQKDMEFLAARKFNKNEIYDIYAPGLSQWLAADTTNANARSGRDAFYELAVAPLLDATGENVTNNVLPAYGDNLTARFEDVRPKDRALMLQEQQAYGQVHTLDEIRERYYNALPIGDERGELLPAEVSSGGGGFNVGLPGRDIIDPASPEEDEDEAAKRSEAAKFHRFAQKRMDEGKPEKIDSFTFDHHTPAEQIRLKSEYRPDTSGLEALSERLTDVIKTLRSANAEPAEANE